MSTTESTPPTPEHGGSLKPFLYVVVVPTIVFLIYMLFIKSD